MKYIVTLTIALLPMLLVGCGSGMGWGFSLPAGEADVGSDLFVSHQCNACHVVSGKDNIQQPDNPQLSIAIGGKVARIKTYGELVTSVINPSHKLPRHLPEAGLTEAGQSAMKNYNEVMTVQELIDIVAFLQSQYELEIYTPSVYPHYPLP